MYEYIYLTYDTDIQTMTVVVVLVDLLFLASDDLRFSEVVQLMSVFSQSLKIFQNL